MTKQKPPRFFEHPHLFGSFSNWIKLLWQNRDIDVKYIPRVMSVTLSTFLTSPLRLYESIRYGRVVRNTVIPHAPIFIVGHWRTGTTHLHNLLSQDKSLGHVSVFQVTSPGFCLVGDTIIKKPLSVFQKKLHPTREIDNIPLLMDNPEEEDVAISNMSPYSYLHMYSFPRRARYFFERYITYFDKLPEATRAKWAELYLTILRKATIKTGGKRLVIKNCADSARIQALLNLFPDARFIHIYRNPYHVYRSTLFLYKTVLPRAQLHEINPDEIETWVIDFYTQLMQKFITEKAFIPDGHLVEVKYEDLEKAPLDQLRKIYETLSLPGFDEAEPDFRAYLASIAGYKKNPQEMDDSVIEKVNQHWQFALDELGYNRLESASGK